MQEGRTLLNFQPIEQPAPGKFLNREDAENRVVDAIRRAESKLLAQAKRFELIGWTIDTTYGTDGFEYSHQSHTIIGRLRLVRS